MRNTYVSRPGHPLADEFGMVPKRLADPLSDKSTKRVHAISDVMPATRHPITGKLMDSKSEFRKVTRAHGCVEVGNDKWPERSAIKNSPRAPDIARAWDELSKR